MEPNQEIDDLGEITASESIEDTDSVDDFIRQLEAKEKDLHITASTTVIEFDDESAGDAEESPVSFELERNDATVVTPVKAAPPEILTSGGSNNGRLESEIDALKGVIAKMFAERQEILDLSHRRNKDFENYKTRTERERTNTFQTQLGNLAIQMLPILDNLDRAVEFAMSLPEGERVEVQQFCDGIILINQQIGEVLGNMGLQTIPTVGHIFDPLVHEAVAMDQSGEYPPNTITAEMLRGYSIGDRVIRHSMVKVSKIDAASPADGTDREYESEDDREDAAMLSEAVRHAEEIGRGSTDTPTTPATDQ